MVLVNVPISFLYMWYKWFSFCTSEFLQYHLLKRLSFLYCLFLPLLLKINWWWVWVYIWTLYSAPVIYVSVFCASRYADDTTLMAEREEELKSLLMKVKEESKIVGLKLNIQKTKIMASGPITSWEIDGETVSDFIFWGSKITADGDCSHEIKRRLLLGRKLWPT